MLMRVSLQFLKDTLIALGLFNRIDLKGEHNAKIILLDRPISLMYRMIIYAL